MTFPHENLSTNELIARLRKQAAAWFSNPNILLLEELFRRLKKYEKDNERS